VESLHTALGKDGWFFPRTNRHVEIEITTLQSLARFFLLYQVSKVDLSFGESDESSPTTAATPWKERQTFLMGALPLVAVELFNHLTPELERKLLFVTKLIPTVRRAHTQISEALRAFATLTEDRGFALLGYSTEDVLKIEKPSVIENKTRLATALLGAQEELDVHLRGLLETKKLACISLLRLQYKGKGILPPLKSSDKILDLCGQN